MSVEPTTTGYHYLEGRVRIGGENHVVGVMIREDANGDLYYNHSMRDRPSAGPRRLEQDAPPGTQAPGLQSRTWNQGGDPNAHIVQLADGLNMRVRALDQSARGRIDILADGQHVIRLFEGHDLSTVLQGPAISGWRNLARDAEAAPEDRQVRKGWETVRGWFADSGHTVELWGQIPTGAHCRTRPAPCRRPSRRR